MAQKVGTYLDRIEEECEQYRSDASKAVKDLCELSHTPTSTKRASISTQHEIYEDSKVRKGLQDKFNRIHLYSEEERKVAGGCNKKLALTAFTNDTMQSEVERGEADDFKLLNAQIAKLDDMIAKMSGGADEELNAVILRGLESINSKLDAVALGSGGAGEQQASDAAKPVS